MNAVKDKIPQLVQEELTAANAVNPPFHSMHEAYAVMLEEVEEARTALDCIDFHLSSVWNCAKRDEPKGSKYNLAFVKKSAENLVCEAIQVCAMAQKTLDYLEEVEKEGISDEDT